MRCAFYARFSSDLQRQTSIDDQVAVARAFAKRNGWAVDDSRVYADAGISGASIDGRPGLQALMAAAAQQPRPFDALLVDDSSRVARDCADAIRVLQTLTFFGIRVVYISQAIDSANEQAETLVAVHGLVDGLYLREARAKIRRGLAGQHSRGYATGAAPFGYRNVPIPDPSGKVDSGGRTVLVGKRVVIEPREAETVRQIFKWYADENLGVRTVVVRLNRAGTPGPRGRRWRAGAVRAVLRCEKYRGLLIWGKQTAARKPGTRQRIMRDVPRDEWHVLERPDLRIISDELWNRARKRGDHVRQAFGAKAGVTLVRGKNAAPLLEASVFGFSALWRLRRRRYGCHWWVRLAAVRLPAIVEERRGCLLESIDDSGQGCRSRPNRGSKGRTTAARNGVACQRCARRRAESCH